METAILDEQEMEYLYDDGEYYYFMNTETLRADAPEEGHAGRRRSIT